MKVFLVYAHPEPASLNGSLKDHAVRELTSRGHEVRVSDLHAMRWKAVADAEDFPALAANERLIYHKASGDAYASGTQRDDVAQEQEKLLWADLVVLQFPLWWFSVPAILKGWIDRVFVHGFAIGVPKPGTRQWLRYGEGLLAGKRAMLAVTTGGREEQYGGRGINGDIGGLLFHLNHGLFHYTGMTVLQPFVAYRTVRTTPEEFGQFAERYVARLTGALDETPVAYRTENGGDYESNGVLKDGLGEGRAGFSIHEG